MDYYVVVIPD